MHTMKNISKYLGVALLLFGAACSKTQEGTYYNPNKDDSKEIHFIQSSIEKEFAQDAQSGTIDVQIARTGNRGSYTVYLAQKTSDLNNLTRFKVPSKVTIPDGKYSVTVPVEVDLSNFIMGSNYKTTLLISKREVNPGDDGAQVSQFSDKVALSASYELTWEPYMRIGSDGGQVQQLATYHYSLYYTGRDSGLEVEKAVGANIFRLKDWASGVAFKFILHDDNTCTVPGQSIGYFNSNYNEYVYVADMAEYTGNESAYASYPCTFDGKDTFSFYLIYYVSSGYFSQGTEKLVFESEPDTTPIVDIEFQGIETTATGFRAPKLYFSPNSYTKFYKASVVEGDITADTQRQDEIRQQLIDDKLEGVVPAVTLYSEDASVWNVPKGNYTAVALAYDSIDNPCKLYSQRFTCDPEKEYGIKVNEFKFYAPTDNLNYSPYNTLIWEMQTSNVATMKYLCVKTDIADYLCEALGMTLEELTADRGYDIAEEMIAELNSEEGRATAFNTLDQGSTYVLALLMTNSFGDIEDRLDTGLFRLGFRPDEDHGGLPGRIQCHGDHNGRFERHAGQLPYRHHARQRPRRPHQGHVRHARLRTRTERLLRQGEAHAHRRDAGGRHIRAELRTPRVLGRADDLLGRQQPGHRLHRGQTLLGGKSLLEERHQQLHVPALQHAAGKQFELPARICGFAELFGHQHGTAQTGVRGGKRRPGTNAVHRSGRTAVHDLPAERRPASDDDQARRQSPGAGIRRGCPETGRRQDSPHRPGTAQALTGSATL